MLADYQIEKQEAINAGKKALLSLKEAKRHLESASGWGIVDMLGGGLISTLFKHSNMNDAAEYMNEAKLDLQAFSKELKDISGNIDLGFNTSDFISFADYFFDGIIADWLVQDRIREARNQVNQAIYQIENILENIK